MLASNVIFVQNLVHLPATNHFVHLGQFCYIYQPKLQGDTSFESKAFLFSNDEASETERYGDASQRTVIFGAAFQDFRVFVTEHLVFEFLDDNA